jgi:hypothetical protein
MFDIESKGKKRHKAVIGRKFENEKKAENRINS